MLETYSTPDRQGRDKPYVLTPLLLLYTPLGDRYCTPPYFRVIRGVNRPLVVFIFKGTPNQETVLLVLMQLSYLGWSLLPACRTATLQGPSLGVYLSGAGPFNLPAV